MNLCTNMIICCFLFRQRLPAVLAQMSIAGCQSFCMNYRKSCRLRYGERRWAAGIWGMPDILLMNFCFLRLEWSDRKQTALPAMCATKIKHAEDTFWSRWLWSARLLRTTCSDDERHIICVTRKPGTGIPSSTPSAADASECLSWFQRWTQLLIK